MSYGMINQDVDDYAASMTAQTHQTLAWLNRNGYLDNEDTEMLLSRMVVVPIRNSPKFGQRLLARFFGCDDSPNTVNFPIVLTPNRVHPRSTHEPLDQRAPPRSHPGAA